MSATLTFLGTAGGGPIPNRAKSGHVLNIDGRLSLLDCGGGSYQSFVNLGLDCRTLDRIVISHTHPDHMSDLMLFIQTIYLTGRSEPLTVYVPEEFDEPLQRMLEACYLFEERFPFELLVEEYDYGVLFSEPFGLEAIPNTHLSKFSEFVTEHRLPNLLQCYSFDITVGRARVLYSSDIGSIEDVLPHLDDHAYVILEAAHVDLRHFFAHAGSAKVGQYIMTHLLSEQQAGEIMAAAKADGVANLIVAHDGLKIDLS